MKTKRDKLKEVLRAMKGESIDFSAFDTSVAELRKSLEEKISIPTIERVEGELEKFKKKLDITTLLTSLEETKKTVSQQLSDLSNRLEAKIKEQELTNTETHLEINDSFDKALSSEINSLRIQIASLDTVGKGELAKVEKDLKTLAEDIKKAIEETDREKEIKDLEDALNKLRIEFLNKLAEKGGGAMNRQMFIGGVDALTKYTDMNLKAGSNVTITYANNNTTKKVDVTISATGGGPGGGIVRSVQSISASQLADSSSGTDYVYICTGTMTLTMPTASSNSNLYTIKNAGTGVITILPDGADTLDNDVSIIMPVRYTAVDLISDSVGNWNIT